MTILVAPEADELVVDGYDGCVLHTASYLHDLSALLTEELQPCRLGDALAKYAFALRNVSCLVVCTGSPREQYSIAIQSYAVTCPGGDVSDHSLLECCDLCRSASILSVAVAKLAQSIAAPREELVCLCEY